MKLNSSCTGIGKHRPPDNCVIFYEGYISDETPYKQICMVGPQKLTTLRFNVKEFKMTKAMSVHTPFNTQVTLFYMRNGVVTIPWVSFKNIFFLLYKLLKLIWSFC